MLKEAFELQAEETESDIERRCHSQEQRGRCVDIRSACNRLTYRSCRESLEGFISPTSQWDMSVLKEN